MKRVLNIKIFSKTLCLLLLALFSFHFSGVETAFCQEDAAPASSGSEAADTHGCMNCQPGQHIAVEIPSASIPSPDPTVFSSDPDKNFLAQAHFSHPFRPPISA